jgi:4-hydroxythreonine-4-phosphate dehydrogenase
MKARARTEASPLLAVSIGCPAGVGPEVAVAAAKRRGPYRILFVGDEATIRRAAELRGLRRAIRPVASAAEAARLPEGGLGRWVHATPVGRAVVPGRPDRACGAAQLAWIDEATDLVRHGVADALVTGPVSKHAIATSRAPGAARFLGHTEHLGEALGAAETVMAFWSERLVTALVTTHLPLARVSRAVTPSAVAAATYWLVRLLGALGSRAPRVVVAALNPHAGEAGLLGDEERRSIAPGIARAAGRLRRERTAAVIEGPVGAETAFRSAAGGKADGVVAMYHDQATIPSKVLAFGDAVNVTLGLPIVRTSVDHGTAYDVAWSGVADARGMTAAMELAARLCRSRVPPIARESPRRS